MVLLRSKLFLAGFFALLFTITDFSLCLSQSRAQDKKTELAGEFFGTEVPLGNYYFAKRVVMSYGAEWRGTPQNEKEVEDLVWQELLFSYEAFRRNVEVTEKEVDDELEKILKENKVDFSWRIDKEKFQEWTQKTLGVSVELFRNQIEHLVKIRKLRQQVLDGINPQVTEIEAYQKFLDEYNTLLVELVQFDELADANKFYDEVKVPVSASDMDKLVWQDALLSIEAVKRQIKADGNELDKAIGMILQDNEAYFRWKEDTAAFEKWSNEKMGVSASIFKARIEQLVCVDTLVKKIAKKEEPEVDLDTEFQQFLKVNSNIGVAYWNFLNARPAASVEILRFDSSYDAKDFYNKIKRGAGVWDINRRKDPERFKRPGFVALDFLLNMWGFDRDAAYKMLDAPLESIYPPAPIYKGYGVFKILKIRKADPAEFDKRKDSYFERVKMIKKYDGFKKWVDEFKEKAKIKRFVVN